MQQRAVFRNALSVVLVVGFCVALFQSRSHFLLAGTWARFPFDKAKQLLPGESLTVIAAPAENYGAVVLRSGLPEGWHWLVGTQHALKIIKPNNEERLVGRPGPIIIRTESEILSEPSNLITGIIISYTTDTLYSSR